MNKNKLVSFAAGILLLTGCTSMSNISDIFSSNSSVPASIQESVASRVNPENELYILTNAAISKSGAIFAQSKANKDAISSLREKIKKEVDNIYESQLNNLDSFSKSTLSPVKSDLSIYATDLIVKKITQKGAWEDASNSKIYSLFTVEKSEINDISVKVLKKFAANAAKKLSDFGKIEEHTETLKISE